MRISVADLDKWLSGDKDNMIFLPPKYQALAIMSCNKDA